MYRFSDFIWLYSELSSNYIGCIVPLHPEKNALAKFNWEGAEFSERRKQELRCFLQKLIKHKFLRRCIELHKFLLNDHAYHDYKNAKKPAKSDAFFDLATRVVYQHLPVKRKSALREPTEQETRLRNLNYFIEATEESVKSLADNIKQYYDLKKRQSYEILNTTASLVRLLEDETYITKAKLLNYDQLSNIEDEHNKKLLNETEPLLRVSYHFCMGVS